MWGLRHRAGEAPDELPYGINALRDNGYQLRGVGTASQRWRTKVRDVVEHRSAMPIERGLRALPLAAKSDVVIALLEQQAFLPALLKGAGAPGFRSTPLVIWSCWLADDLRKADPDQRAWLKKRIVAADLITHLSRHETEIFIDLGIPEDRLFPVTYGVSHRFYTPEPSTPKDIELLAVGQDRGRDYRTLIDAVRGTTLFLDIVCKPDNLAGIDIPGNVRIHPPVSLSTYRNLLRRAQVVAVPTHDLAYPTGSSVALEAAATGCAIAVTGTRAMRDYFTDGVDARLVTEGDASAWRATLEELRSDADLRTRISSAARMNVETVHNADAMWSEFARVLSSRGLT